jgi:hypothetical protein
MPVTGGDERGQWLLPLLDLEMELGGQPGPGASEPVVGGFGVDTAGPLPLQVPFLRAPAACW